jgi:RNA polymerase sigma factor (sigma-70 family)
LRQTRPIVALDPSEFEAVAGALRPELHRYCARLTGSVIDGEDVVQDTLACAFNALATLEKAPSLRAWLFRIAHNRALDFVRSRALRAADSLDAAGDTVDPQAIDPLESLMRREAVETAVSRFVALPPQQRSAVILKDVLDHSLQDIASLLDTSVDAVKAHLARGRARLEAINARSAPARPARPPSPQVAQYAALFNGRDWDGLRALLADGVRLKQSSHPMRAGAADVGMFFTLYAKMDDLRLAPAWLGNREVLAVFDGPDAPKPSSMMWLAWEDDKIAFIRDYRYDRYVMDDVDLVLARELR